MGPWGLLGPQLHAQCRVSLLTLDTFTKAVCLAALLVSSGTPAQSNPTPHRGAVAPQVTARRREDSKNPETLFAPAVVYGSGGYQATSVAVADVNGDGKPDLLVVNQCANINCTFGAVGVLLGNGDGTFQTVVAYGSGGWDAWELAAVDVNGDGKLDLLVANECGDIQCATEGTVGVLLGNGDGTFQTAVPYDSGGYGARWAAVADVNGDGKPDLLVANLCADQNCDTYAPVGVLLGNGDGTFQTAVTYHSGGNFALSVVVADVNGDGNPDLVVGMDNFANYGTAGVLLGNGDGTFQTAVTYGEGGRDISVADVNEDGKLDLLVGSNDVAVMLGNGDGTFQPVVSYSSGGLQSGAVAVADVNEDGKLDLVLANECTTGNCNGGHGAAGVLLGNGDGTFRAVMNYDSGDYDSLAVAVGDVNGDGKPDVVMTNVCNSESCNTGGYSNLGVLLNISTTTLLLSSSNPSSFGQGVTFTASVNGHLTQVPTGTVSFFNGTTNLGSSPLDGSGVATLSISTLAAGTSSITAVYNGTAEFGSSTSPVLSQVVQDFSLAAVPPTSQTVTPGRSVNYSVALDPVSGFSHDVSLSCGGAPAQSTCTVIPSMTTLDGSHSVTIRVAVVTQVAAMGFMQPLGGPPASSRFMVWGTYSGVLGLALLAGAIGGQRRWRPRLLSTVALVAALSLVVPLPGCGGGGSGGGTPLGTYNLTVTGTFTSGSTVLSHSTILKLVVQ